MTEAKFKIGDRVRAIGPHSILRSGDEYTVKSAFMVGIRPRINLGHDHDLEDGWDPERFELLSDSPEPSERKPLKTYVCSLCHDGEYSNKCSRCGGSVATGPTAAEVREAYGAKPKTFGEKVAEYNAANAVVKDGKVVSIPAEPKLADPYADERTGPYGGNDLSHEQHVAALMVEHNRKVKVLREEMGREVTGPRFPHEGKSDRVTGYRRW
jgi:hypothetical protein